MDEYSTAVLYGSVAASFAIEQSGLPRLSSVGGEEEIWNESEPGSARLSRFRRGLGL